MLDLIKIAKIVFKNKPIVLNMPGRTKIALRKGVFIPDMRTKLFINATMKIVNRYRKNISVIADVGTGSGVIAISLAKKFINKEIYAYDISSRAIRLARYNTTLNKITNISFFRNKNNNWMSSPMAKKVDFVVSNPPYVGDIEYFSVKFKREYPDAKYQPVVAIRSYDRYGLKPYVGILRAAKSHRAKYIFFRCNTRLINKIKLELSKIDRIRIRDVGPRTNRNSFLFIERLDR